MANRKKKNNKRPRVNGTITAIQSVSIFTVDDKYQVVIGPGAKISGVAVTPTGLVVGQQVQTVGHTNKHKTYIADAVVVAAPADPEPVAPIDPDDEEDVTPVEPNPEPSPEPDEDAEPAPNTDQNEDDAAEVDNS